MLTHAKAFIAAGLVPLPLRGKACLVPDWPTLLAEDLAKPDLWFPGCNIGVRLGAGIVGLDVDPRAGGLEWWRAHEAEVRKTGLVEVTGRGDGGVHIYWSADVGFKRSIAPGVDLMGLGHQFVTAPSLHPDTGKPYVLEVGGTLADQAWSLQPLPEWIRPPVEARSAPVARQVGPLGDRDRERLLANLADTDNEPGHRHDRAIGWACAAAAAGMDAAELTASLVEWWGEDCDMSEAERIVAFAERKAPTATIRDPGVAPERDFLITGGAQGPLRITERPSVIDNSGGDTDLDAGAQIAARHSDKLAWTPELGWLSWSGKRWETGAMAEASAAEWAKQEARRARQAAEAIQDEELRKRKVAAAKAREDMTRVEKALRSARTDTRLLRPVGSWDADPWLLTVENGTLDLRTGGLRPHSPADASTKLAPVYYNPDATHPVLEGYLADLDAQLAGFSSFLARCFGMALTGDVSAESVFILTGEGGSGKTTLLAAIAAILGEYAAKVAFEQLCASKYGRSGHSSELIRLRQVRLAYAAEGGASARLDEGRIKELTGDEAISAREVYKAQTEFQPRFKLWLVSNYDPRCEADDTGMWRRICKLSFQAIPETKRNIRIKETLRDDPGARSAVLAWCVRGCLDWQARGRGRRGLAIPGEVDVWTKGYQTSLDQLSLWWQEMTRPGGEYRLDPNGSVATAIVRGRYDAWAKDEGFPPVSPPRFNRHMKAVGLRKSTTKGAQAWMGVSRG